VGSGCWGWRAGLVGGPYEVTISYIGFKSHSKNNIYLSLGKTQNIDVALAEDSEVLDEIVVVSEGTGTFGSDQEQKQV